jgi:thymidylate kinase
MKKTLFVNLFGGPCSGKSTLCASVFTKLKMEGIDCEMALEYAKDVVWEESFTKLKNQIYIFGKQHSRINRLLGKVDVVITDSPLINSIIYDDTKNKYLKDLVLHEFSKLNTINYFLNRSTEYNPNGRTQTKEAALEVDKLYRDILETNFIPYKNIELGNNNTDIIIFDIFENIKNSI